MTVTSVLERFEAQAARTPHVAALLGEGYELPYGELNATADRLANHLTDLGVGTAQRVVLALPRGLRLVVAGLAVLKVGADPLSGEDWSTAQLGEIIRTARPALVIGQETGVAVGQVCAEAGVTFLDVTSLRLPAVCNQAGYVTPTGTDVADLLASLIDTDGAPRRDLRPAVAATPVLTSYPMSPAQQQLWFLDQYEGPSPAYNMSLVHRLRGRLDVPALRRALGDVVARHETLRTVLREVDGRPVQVVLPPAAVAFHKLACAESELPDVLAQQSDHIFDLTAQPPLQVTLISLGPDDHVLMLLSHLAVCDGWSRQPLLRDLALAYDARVAGIDVSWTALSTPYRDYAARQRALVEGAGSVSDRQLEFWERELAGIPVEMDYPTDRPRTTAAARGSGTCTADFGTDLHNAMATVARATGTTMSMVAHAALATVLTRLGAGNDIPIGTQVAGRTDPALAGLVGCFANPLVIRVDTSGNPTFEDLLARVRATTLAADEHQDVPFDRVVEKINPPRSPARNPIFQIMLNVWPDDTQKLRLTGLAATDLPGRPQLGTLDIAVDLRATLLANGQPGPVQAEVGYAAGMFGAATVRTLLDRLARVICSAAAEPNQRICDIAILSAEERAQLLAQGAGPAPDRTALPQRTVVEAFRQQAASTPLGVAVRCAGRSLTYRELDEQSNRLAQRLIAAGVGPESPVATFLDRTVDLVVALTAILKAGGYYVPLHHAAPLDRMQWVLRECGAQVLLSDRVMSERGLPEADRVVFVDDPETAALPATDPLVAGYRDQLAYVMYTSGSTGQPKGVAITHGDVLELVSDSIFAPGDHDRVLLLTPYEFDPSTYSFWYPLLHGGTAVIAPAADLTVERLARLMRREKITGVDITAGLFRVMAEEDPACFADVRVVITGGDVVSPIAVRRVLERCPDLLVRSNYGPTETTLFATSAPWCRAADVPAPVPIGRPLDGMFAYVLDERLGLVPGGVVGDLYLAGAGLARGYLGRADLTAERFVANPHGATGTRMYHTGDRVRWTSDGLLDFVGRADGQVKIRGFRIELPEIEAVLGAVPGVRQVAVVAREDQPGDKRLVAYLVADEEDLDDAAVDRHLRQQLPEYMVPSAIVRLGSLPLTANNKVDHRALPAPQMADRFELRPPSNETEAVLCDIFSDLLHLDQVGVTENLFELGGHSLLATRLVSRIRVAFGCELTIKAVFEAPTPAGLGKLVSQAPTARPALRPAVRPDRVPLSPAQTRLWFLNRLEGRSAAYSLPLAIRVRGYLDPAVLETALGDVFARHENLRTIFPEIDGRPYQVVLPVDQVRPTLPVQHVEDVEAALHAASRVPFDPTTSVPLRAQLFGLAPDEHVLLLTLNHIGSDGWSMRPLARDLRTAYGARLAGQAPDWEPLPVQYADYTLWQQTVLGDPEDPASLAARQLDYWRLTLDGCVEELELPADNPRPAVASYRGARLPVTMDQQVHEAIVALCRGTNTTVFMVLHAALSTLLHRLGAGTDVPIGTPVAGRTDAALEDLVGFFVNTLVLRTDVSGDPSFRTLLDRVRQTDLAAYEHQDVPFEQVVEALNPGRSLARNPLFQVMLEVSVEFERYRIDLPGLETRAEPLDTGTALFDLLFTFNERYAPDGTPVGITGALEFSTDLFRPETARLLADRFRVLLKRLVNRPDQPLSELDLFLDGERDRVMHAWNATRVPLPAISLPELVQRQVAQHPQAQAVRAHDGHLSYTELNAQANQLAHLLLARGIGPGSCVGVALQHSRLLVVAFLAVLKAGAAYLPIDTSYPENRIHFILDDTNPAVILTTERDASWLPGELWVLDRPAVGTSLAQAPEHDPTDADRPAPLTGETPHYIVYTSGSTGKPKGVVVPARVLMNEVAWNSSVIPYQPGSRVSQFGSIGFDISEYEMLMALLNGKALCVPDQDTRSDLSRFAAWLDREKVTEFNAPDLVIAAVYEAAMEQGLALDSLRHVIQGGEALQLTPLVREFHAARPALTLHNQYGPSETHFVTGTPLPSDVDDWPATPSIGASIWNTQLYVLDSRLSPLPVGVAGELYMAGDCLAHAYHNRPDLTAARFVANPFGDPGARMYRSGDIVRWRADGMLDFLGRVDDQVKIRGVRIELGELNAVIAAHPAVAQAATVLRRDRPGDKRLVAYIVPTPGAETPSAAALRRHVGAAVPEAVIPAAFVGMGALPLNTNGKLDRRALPAPDYSTVTVVSREPTTLQEEILCGLFAEVLGVDVVGVDDNFFDLGGHSLLVTRLISRLRVALNREVAVRTVFEAATPAGLARRLDTAGRGRTALSAMPRPEQVPMSYAQQRLWFLNQLEGPSATYNLPVSYRIRGPLVASALEAALTDLTERHESLRTLLREVGGRPVQVVLPAASVALHRIACPSEELPDVIRPLLDHPFDLAAERPMRATLISVDGTDEQVLLLLFHHVVNDGWSLRPLARDLSVAYQARVAGRVPQWAPLPLQYADYALWQRSTLGAE
ncbi:amino acid adenylation domain-containing protein, partial [Micromonospora sp. NPDC000089]|uniref:amino acid adenylation domain-containing protein n=1 Tax=unclassified Micromonospora TaxID=2617518 RepID=UPI00368ED9E3